MTWIKQTHGKTVVVTLPRHAVLKAGTLTPVMRQAGWSRRRLLELL